MDQKQIVNQMIEFHKSAFMNSFNAMVMLQDQTEKVMQNFLGQAAWIPEDMKKSINEWTSSCKKGRDEFRKTIDENFRRVDDFFNQQGKASGKK